MKTRADFATDAEWVEHNKRALDLVDHLKSDEFWDDVPPDWRLWEDVSEYFASRFRKSFRWIFRQTLCRVGRHTVFIRSRDIDLGKAVLPAHCKNCGVPGRYDVQYDVFVPTDGANQ